MSNKHWGPKGPSHDSPWYHLVTYMKKHPQWSEGTSIPQLTLDLIKERDAIKQARKDIVVNQEGKAINYAGYLRHEARHVASWQDKIRLFLGSPIVITATFYFQDPVTVNHVTTKSDLQSVRARLMFIAKTLWGIPTGQEEPLPSVMQYEFNKIVGNQVIGLSINLAPKQTVEKHGPRVKAKEWESWSGSILEAMNKVATGEPAHDAVEVQINHPGGGFQQMTFEDLKPLIILPEDNA